MSQPEQQSSHVVALLEEAPPRLPHFVRFRDLRAAGIADNWPYLLNLIENHGFPQGTLPSPNVRAWDIDEVKRWLNARPTARKVVPPAKRPRRRAANASKTE